MNADIKYGYACNNNCIHCVIAGQRGLQDLGTQEYKKCMTDSFSAGADHLIITGGEPTVRKDILEILAYAKKLGFPQISMQTNGRRFHDLEFAKKAASFGITTFVVSIHGHTPEVHEAITRAEGSFSQTKKGFENLIALGQPVVAKVVISKRNLAHILDIVKMLAGMGVKRANFAFPHPLGNAWEYFGEVVPGISESAAALTQAIDFVEERGLGIFIDVEAVPFCLMRGYEHHSSDLRMAFTEIKAPGGAFVPGYEVVRAKDKAKRTDCIECRYFPICEGPWKEYPQKLGWSEFVPVPGAAVDSPNRFLEEAWADMVFGAVGSP